MTAQNYGYMARHITSTERIPARSLEKEVKVTKSNITICRPHMGGSILPADTGPRHPPPSGAPPRSGRGREEGSGPGKKKGARPGKSLDFRVAPPQRRQPPALPPFRAVPSAHAGLTSLFGMGRGVAPPRRRRLCFRDPQAESRMPGERTSK